MQRPSLGILGLAVSVAAAAPPEPRDEARGVLEFRWGEGTPSWEDLRARGRSQPVLIRDIQHESFQRAAWRWRPEVLTEAVLGARASLTARTMRGGDARVMRYRDPSRPFHDPFLDLNWTSYAYDDWEIEPCQLEDILQPDLEVFRSFSTTVDTNFSKYHESGYEALEEINSTVCRAPGCGKSQLWITSRGLSPHLHFDPKQNALVQLHGDAAVLLSPPEAVLEDIAPGIHPAEGQSQLGWYTGVPAADEPRPRPSGMGAEDEGRGVATRELRADLRPGDVLIVPAFWGHQTLVAPGEFGLGPPSISYRIFTSDRSRDSGVHKLREEALGGLLKQCTSLGEYWGVLRTFGGLLVSHLVPKEDAQAFYTSWEARRWGPQLADWDVKLGELSLHDASLPAGATSGVFCAPPPSSVQAKVRKAAKALARYLQKWCDRLDLPPRDRPLVRRYEAGNALDRLPAYILLAVRNGLEIPGAQVLGLMLRSFYDCPPEMNSIERNEL